MNLDKLKETARRYELREEWRRAIDAYHRVAEELSAAGEPVDPALYNRIGDLEIKTSDGGAALTAYRRAADLYAEQGFFNNAIALCGKILRVDPGQTQTYLRLAELHARKNVIPEARRNLIEYVDRMLVVRQQEKAVEALKDFALRFSGSQELLQTLTQLLKQASGADAPDAHTTLERLVGGAEAGRDPASARPQADREEATTQPVQGLVFIDTGIAIPGLRGLLTPAEAETRPSGRVTLDSEVGSAAAGVVEYAPSDSRSDAPPLSGFEPTVLGDTTLLEAFEVSPLLPLEEPEPVDVPGLEPRIEFGLESVDAGFPRLSVEPLFDDALSLETLSVGRVTEEPVPRAGGTAEERGRGSAETGSSEAMFDTLEVDVEDQFAVLAETASASDLERALAASEAAQDWPAALRVAAGLVRRDPDNIARYQKRVELAYHANDWRLLVAAYLALADVLMRRSTPDNAALVYERVLDHDPENPVALAALAALRPAGPAPGAPSGAEPPAASPGGDFVDLGALILEPEPERDSRMRVEQTEPVGDEDKDFVETLTQFKEGIAANIDASDFQAHYDLGIAFKEMGLLDEAIAQFQKALRAPEGRLKTSEALGIAFYEKGRYSIAEAVLSRAVEAIAGADDEKIGLLYWLGRTVEAQGRPRDALRWYERAMAVDITFLDVSDRLRRLADEGDRS